MHIQLYSITGLLQPPRTLQDGHAWGLRTTSRPRVSGGSPAQSSTPGASRPAQSTPPPSLPFRYCTGTYADDFIALSAEAREFDEQQAPYTYCIRTALRERNVVDVRGFPLGILRANNVGKVVSAYDHDEERDWDHDDFVVDALLSPGNSGSPVLAISCTTGEFELVGVYHAGYFKGSALNVVVGIDQLRDLLTTLKRSPRARKDAATSPDQEDRLRLFDLARGDAEPLYFPFGSFAAAARTRPDGALLFELMAKDFPLRAHPALVLEDLPATASEGFGRLGRFWTGNRQGLKEVERSRMDADILATLAKLLDGFRRSALLAGSYHAAMRSGMSSRERFLNARRLERTVHRTAEGYQDLAQAAVDIVERLCPATTDATSTLADALTPPAPPVQQLTAPTSLFQVVPLSSIGTDGDPGWHLVFGGDAPSPLAGVAP